MPLGSVLFAAWAAAVAWCDCRDRRIANGLVAVGGAAALTCALMHASPFGLAPEPAVFGMLAGFAALLPFFLLRVMGAADVKVFAVLGAWCGVSALPGLWMTASIAAAVHAIGLLVAARWHSGSGSAWPLWRNGHPTFAVGTRRATPYAALLAGAASLHLLGSLLQGATR